jgi:hypothetical protein
MIPVRAIQHVGLVLLCSIRPPEEGTPTSKRVAVWYLSRLVFCDLYFAVFMECVCWLMYWKLCSELRHFMINHFNTSVSTSRDCFQEIGMRPCGRRFHFPHYPVTAQFTCNSVKLCIWLCEVQCFHAYVTTMIQSRVYSLTKINVHVFWSAWGYCIHFIVRIL